MTLEVKGNSIVFGFGLYFLGKAQSDKKTDLNGLLKGLVNNTDVIDLMYISAKTEAYLDEKDLSFNRREFIDLILSDENSLTLIEKWSNEFVESVKGHFLPQEESEDSKENSEKKN